MNLFAVEAPVAHRASGNRKRAVLAWACCETCGNTFGVTRSRPTRFCSRACWYGRNVRGDGTKACGICKQPKRLDAFGGRKDSPCGRDAFCKDCRSAKTTRYFADLKRTDFVKLIAMKTAGNFCYGNKPDQKMLRLALEVKILAAVGKSCPYCFVAITFDNVSVDHVLPTSRGGSKTDPLNMQITCMRCNTMKGNLGHETFVRVAAFARTLPDEDRAIFEARLLSGHTRFTRKR